jgi:steroid delta-isomerase-like uncharacterized protein
MTRDEIVALFARRQEAANRRDAMAMAGCHAEDGVAESPMAGGTVMGRSAIERTYRAFVTAFPDLKTETEELVIDGDKAAWLFTISGTDQGGFMGLPPTGKPFFARMATVSLLRNGEIVHERRVYDFTGLLVQVGLLKTKPA